MRVLLMTWGSRGDVEPLLALAGELAGRGVEVRMCAPPDFAARVEGAGVPFVPVGLPVRDVVTTRPSPADVAAALVAAHFDVVGPAARDCDAVVACGLMPAGVPSVAQRLGIPYVHAGYHRIGMPSPHHRPARRPGEPLPAGETDPRVLWRLDAERVDALYAGPLNARRAGLGLPPVQGVRDHVLTPRPWLAVDPVLWPPEELLDLDPVETGAWLVPDDRPLPADVAAFLDDGDPPVYVGFGSMRMDGAPDAGEVAVAAARAHGRRVLLSRGWADLAAATDGGAGGDVLAVGDMNHRSLFRRVAAVVHHGGAGTTTAAALAGAPQVVVGQIVDQPYWAGRVAALGVGAAHDGPVPTPGSLSAALDTALRDGTAARAREVGALVRTDGATVAAARLVDLVEGGTGVSGGPPTTRTASPSR